MNPIAEEILMHYGMSRRSGRYPWGSGENPYQHSGDFLSRVDELKSQGMSDTEIAKARLIFDPPLSSAVIASMEKMIAEAEWRLNVAAETDEEKSEEYESYDGEYRITPKAFRSQMLDTENKVLDRNIVVTEVPYYETGNAANGVTSYIAKEGDSK